jgi:hypothetical protein
MEDVPASVLAQYPVMVLGGLLDLTPEQLDGWTTYMHRRGVVATLNACDRDALIPPGATGSSLTPDMLAKQ